MDGDRWEGRSKGTLLGYKIYIFFLDRFGLSTAYFILAFIVFYYFLFSFRSSAFTYAYFRKRMGYPRLKSILSIYRNYYKLGQALTDRVAVSTDLRDSFTYEHFGIDQLMELMEQKKGGLMISAHVGNFEMSHFFLERRYPEAKISMVTTDEEQQSIKEYLEAISMEPKIGFILIRDDMSHIFEIHSAIRDGEIVVITGDRYYKGNKTLSANFLGKKAQFPLGPFRLGSRLDVPVNFVYVMKDKKRKYNLYAFESKAAKRDEQGLLEDFVGSMEQMLHQYPLQWFNYFDFWSEPAQQ